jgi:uncharacterized membrane protein HdeD (DUF308 family)
MTSEALERSSSKSLPWWLVLIEGVALLLLGMLLMVKPEKTSVIVVQFLGIYWFLGGIFKIVGLVVDRSMWAAKLIAGILGIIAGILVIQHPLWSATIVGNTLIILLGFVGLVYGGVSLYQAFSGAGWARGILGAVSILLGIALLVDVWAISLSLPWTLGLLAFVGGFVVIAQAFVNLFAPE